MSEQESDAEYQLRMDRIALKLGNILDGEDLLETSTVLCGMAAFAIVCSTKSKEQRRKILNRLVQFMRRQIAKDISEEPRRGH
jgi:hypothetical protein